MSCEHGKWVHILLNRLNCFTVWLSMKFWLFSPLMFSMFSYLTFWVYTLHLLLIFFFYMNTAYYFFKVTPFQNSFWLFVSVFDFFFAEKNIVSSFVCHSYLSILGCRNSWKTCVTCKAGRHHIKNSFPRNIHNIHFSVRSCVHIFSRSGFHWVKLIYQRRNRVYKEDSVQKSSQEVISIADAV